MKSTRRVYLYPFTHSNGFIERTKSVLSRQGFSILPLKELYSLNNFKKREKNSVLLNWYEDQPFRQGLSGIRRILFIIGFLLSLLAMRLFSYRIIWLRHNFKPHNLQKTNRLYRLIIWLMHKISHEIVTLERVTAISTQTVRHPLYKSDIALQEFKEDSASHPRNTEFLYFGVIKPYKRLDALLNAWPEMQPLKIMGKCADADHTRLLHEIIARRGLAVSWQNAFIEQDALESAVADSRFVIIPHEDGAMISSGTFYMALSLGANVLCFDSAFGRAKSKEFNFVHVLNADNLQEQLSELNYTDSEQVINQAMQRYGEREVLLSWQKVL
ncbi:glycosyltransferase family protein [Salinimonas chungwhensis]|uniref:hypothetical protein n=1 Tax=Salinimonas chungwhensis TaxID=265425 RepID=UPI000364D8BD|nr:hypothetical protein [Salinimonas chungwhensis]